MIESGEFIVCGIGAVVGFYGGDENLVHGRHDAPERADVHSLVGGGKHGSCCLAVGACYGGRGVAVGIDGTKGEVVSEGIQRAGEHVGVADECEFVVMAGELFADAVQASAEDVAAAVDEGYAVAKLLDASHVVCRENDGRPFVAQLEDFTFENGGVYGVGIPRTARRKSVVQVCAAQ